MNTLKITATTISYNHNVIKVSNISSVDLKENHPKTSWVLIIIAAILIYWSIDFIRINFFYGVPLLLLAGLLLFLNFRTKKRSKKYFLEIRTNAGNVELFSHRDYDFVNGIRLNMQEALSDSFLGSVTYNVDNKTIINNPTGSISIINTSLYEGMSKDQMEFLSSKFENALNALGKQVKNIANDSEKRDYEMLISELKSQKPRKSILKAAWDGLAGISSVADVGQIIEKGISMF